MLSGDQPSENDAFVLRRTGDGYTVEWRGLATLHVGGTSSFHAEPTADSEVVAKLRRGPAVAVERYLRRTGLAFHGAAVGRNERAVIFSGAPGAGKSTLAALLCQRGAALLADDVAMVRLTDTIDVEPTEDVHFLDETSRTMLGLTAVGSGKLTIEASSTNEPHRLCAFMDLLAVDAPFRRLSGVEAMRVVTGARLCPPTSEPARMLEDFEIVSRLVGHIAVVQVGRATAIAHALALLSSETP